MEYAISLAIGMAAGTIIFRLGYGLGFKAVYQMREDLPLTGKKYKPIEQDRTGDIDTEEDLVRPQV